MAEQYRRTTCRSCRAPVFKALTAAGNSTVVDVDPHPNGNIELRVGERGLLLSRVVKAADRDGREDLYRSHFATCPDAASWRKR